MSLSGIVRKIDDLGRIVIPKEIRKNLNIKNNEEMEIVLDNNKVVLLKYSRIENMKNIFKEYSKIFEKFLISDYAIIDTSKVLYLSKKYQNNFENISLSLSLIIQNRKTILEETKKNIKVCDSLEFNKYTYICPIVINADLLGGIILFSDNKIVKEDILIIEVIMSLLKFKIEN